jgi:hypothetical protein
MGCGSSSTESVQDIKKTDNVNIPDVVAKIEEIKAKYPDNCCA